MRNIAEVFLSWGLGNLKGKFPIEFRDGYIWYPVALKKVYDPNTGEVLGGHVWRGRRHPDVNQKGMHRFKNPSREELPPSGMPACYVCDYDNFVHNVSNTGIVNLVEGDKDYWTLLAVGLENSAGILSASVKGGDVRDYFRDIPVRRINLFPDLDVAGVLLAQSVVDAFRDTDVEVFVYAIPLNWGGHKIKDIHDLWVACNFNLTDFQEALKNCRKFDLPENDVRSWSARNDHYVGELFDVISHEYLARSGYSGELKFRNNGFAEHPSPCPFAEHEHDDTSPAFYLNKKHKIGYCFKCGSHFLMRDMAEAYGIEPSQYINKSATTPTPPTKNVAKEVIEKELYGGDTGLPSEISTEYARLLASRADLGVGLDEATVSYLQSIHGEKLPKFRPIENPLSHLIGDLRGNALVLQPPVMSLFIGVSGGGKTTLSWEAVRILSERGLNVIVWSPEWTAEQNAARLVHHYNGISVSRTAEHLSHLTAMQYGDLEAAKRLRRLSEEELIAAEAAAAQASKSMRGEVFILNSRFSDVNKLSAQLLAARDAMLQRGCPPSAVFIDYLQLIAPPPHARNWTFEDTIARLKEVNSLMGTAMFCVSQSRKADSKAVSDGDAVLGDTSGVGVRPDKFNLIIALSPTSDYVVGGNGVKYRLFNLSVQKNSTGGVHLGSPLQVYLSLRNMRFYTEDEILQ